MDQIYGYANRKTVEDEEAALFQMLRLVDVATAPFHEAAQSRLVLLLAAQLIERLAYVKAGYWSTVTVAELMVNGSQLERISRQPCSIDTVLSRIGIA